MGNNLQDYNFNVGQTVKAVKVSQSPLKSGELYTITGLRSVYMQVAPIGHEQNNPLKNSDFFLWRFEPVEECDFELEE
jgi:hypothetical protein